MSADENRARVEELGHDAAGRQLLLLDSAGTNDVPARLPLSGPYFTCVLAWDARQASADEIGLVAERLLEAGCVYVCCWGPDCERVHDVFDEVDVAQRPSGPWAVTTWHATETLDEVIAFATTAANPDEAFASGCQSVVGVAIGSTTYADRIMKALGAARR